MEVLKKYRFLLFLFSLFLLTRLVVLIRFPLFGDEAIYLYWAQQLLRNFRFNIWISLIDGKQPLFIWLTSVFMHFIANPIVAGRLVSFCAAFGSFTGVYLVTKEFFDKQTAHLALVLYLILPFFLIYDVLALMDGLLLCLSIFSCYLAVILAKRGSILVALGLGVVMGLGLLTKSSATFFLLLSAPATLFALNKTRSEILKLICLFALSISVALGIGTLLRLSTYFPVIAQKNHLFIRTTAEVIQDPVSGVFENTKNITSWLFGYLGLGIFLFAPVGVLLKKQKYRETFFLLAHFLIPILALILYGKQLFPRYVLFMCWPLVILSAHGLMQVRNTLAVKHTLLPFALVAFFSVQIFTTYTVLINPDSAKLPALERLQFFEGNFSGTGLPELYTFFDSHQDQKVVILVDNPLGVLPNGLNIRYAQHKNMKIIGADDIQTTQVEKYREKYPENEMFLLLTWQGGPPPGVETDLALSVPKEHNPSLVWRVYRVK
ncbi:MAG TPA: glycosyltransferase family 39 protein [Vitreimonas sp.]|nr:glycosyltransferase family 39 protein [Vitreimonas sp.]